MALYPDLHRGEGAPVLVIGGGNVGAEKVRGLLAAEADITVVSPGADRRAARARGRRPHHAHRARVRGSGSRRRLGVGDGRDGRRRDQRRGRARGRQARGLWVNAADDPTNCDFILPAVVRKGKITLAASTSGTSPALARRLREELDAYLTEDMPALADLLAEVRQEIRQLRDQGRERHLAGRDRRTAARAAGAAQVRAGAGASDRRLGMELTPVGVEHRSMRQRKTTRSARSSGRKPTRRGGCDDAHLARRHLAQDGAGRGARALRLRARANCRRCCRGLGEQLRRRRRALDVQPHRGLRRRRDGSRAIRGPIVALLSEMKGEPPMEGAPFFALSGDDAARHLFRVAAGIESMVVGEIGDPGPGARRVHRRDAGGHAHAGALAAVPHGDPRRAQGARADDDRPAAGVRQLDRRWTLARETLGDLSEKTVLVIGAGEAGQLTAGNLAGAASRGCS